MNLRTWNKFKAETADAPATRRILAALLEPGQIYTGQRIVIQSGKELRLLVANRLLELVFTYDVILTEKMYQVVGILLHRLEKERAGTYTPTAFYNMLNGHIGTSIVAAFYNQENLFNTEN
jgi:hypothetical protein